jgi:UDP-2-acetamido-2,6-beta-L-arabino-hexul-4-ose reductase
MIKVGITGQSGFVGNHLYNTLGLFPDKFERIPFEDRFFTDKNMLQNFVTNCDSIVHLAGINRHEDEEVLYQTNIDLANYLIEACEDTYSKPHIIFSSSIQEERNNKYGLSKKKCRLLFEKWAGKNNSKFSGFLIPNIFGPFGLPYYNSVVATFCFQLTHDEYPKIEIDNELNLIYVGELIKEIISDIELKQNENIKGSYVINVTPTKTIQVSELLNLLQIFKTSYFENGIIPALEDQFKRNLFKSFLCYINHSAFFPFRLDMHADNRGSFAEIIRMSVGGQVSFSTTVPGITRGNHYHTRKTERFAVIRGKARMEIRRIGTNTVHSFELNGDKPAFIDIPIWFTHNITNTGDEDLYTILWTDEQFASSDSDTFFEIV